MRRYSLLQRQMVWPAVEMQKFIQHRGVYQCNEWCVYIYINRGVHKLQRWKKNQLKHTIFFTGVRLDWKSNTSNVCGGYTPLCQTPPTTSYQVGWLPLDHYLIPNNKSIDGIKIHDESMNIIKSIDHTAAIWSNPHEIPLNSIKSSLSARVFSTFLGTKKNIGARLSLQPSKVFAPQYACIPYYTLW